jgi:photosystem II stability/assembly factor-like uncharacterized protein
MQKKFIYQGAVIKSDDGGKTFKSISEEKMCILISY